jgi:hypothetical protein
MRGRMYRDFEGKVLYPFGFWLSCARIEYGKPVSVTAERKADGVLPDAISARLEAGVSEPIEVRVS